MEYQYQRNDHSLAGNDLFDEKPAWLDEPPESMPVIIMQKSRD